MIEVSGLSKSYNSIRAVDDVSFVVGKGEIIGFLGPNGAGKTTTMRIITGAIPSDTGSVKVAGFDVFESPMEVKKRIGYLPENPPVYSEMTVSGYLAFVSALKGIGGREQKAGVDRAMERCNITTVAKRLIGNLSKGYKQRVGIAQAILGNPEVLILDEPTIGLDPNQIHEVRGLIRELANDKTVVLSTHILPEVEMTCQRVIVINRGKIVATDSIDNIISGRNGSLDVYVRISGDRDEAMKTLRAALKVNPTAADEEGAFIVPFGMANDRREELASSLVGGGFGLIEMRALGRSLEDVFRKLTTDESTKN